MRRWFSIVEILVALGLIVAMGAIATSSYFSLERSAKMEQVRTDFTAFLSELDREVSTNVISDYAIFFTKGAPGIILERNSYQLVSPLKILSFDWISLTGSISMGAASGYTLESVWIPGITYQASAAIETFTLTGSAQKMSTLQWVSGASRLNSFEFISLWDLFASSSVQSIDCSNLSTIDKCMLTNIRGKKEYRAIGSATPPGEIITFLGKTDPIEYTLRIWK
jgi:type II secretory pathway pseudopilin PulG